MNRQQKPKRSPLRPDYLVIVIIILLAIGMYFFFTEMMAPKVKQFDEFEFIAAIESGLQLYEVNMSVEITLTYGKLQVHLQQVTLQKVSEVTSLYFMVID